MKISGSVVSLSSTCPHPPEDIKNKKMKKVVSGLDYIIAHKCWSCCANECLRRVTLTPSSSSYDITNITTTTITITINTTPYSVHTPEAMVVVDGDGGGGRGGGADNV